MNGKNESTTKNLLLFATERRSHWKENFKSDLEEQNRISDKVQHSNKFFSILYNHVFLIKHCLVIIIVGTAFLSCSGADPVIYSYKWDLQAIREYPDKNIYERLIVHILADDEDGYDEIYETYVIHDESERYWRITKDEWKIIEFDDVKWIAINSIVSEDYSSLPRGSYRILVLDYSGYRDEREFTISARYPRPDALSKQRLSEDHFIDDTFFPEFRKMTRNTYLPLLRRDRIPYIKDLYMQLVHPLPRIDGAGNILFSQNKEFTSLLGENGPIYKIEPNSKISFTAAANSRFQVYLHYRLDDLITMSSGPFIIRLSADTEIHTEPIEDIVNEFSQIQ